MQAGLPDSHDVAQAAASGADSNAAPREKHPLRAILVIFLVVTAINAALSFILIPYGSYAEVVWSEYNAHPEREIETLLLGSSYAQFAFDPVVFEETLDSPVFCMATPAQSFTNSAATIERVIRDHNVERVILGFSLDMLYTKPWINSAVKFTQSKILGETPLEAAEDIGRLLFDDYFVSRYQSIAALFPWTVCHVKARPATILMNVRNRLTVATPIEASAILYPMLTFDDYCRAADDGRYNFNNVEKIEFLACTGEPDAGNMADVLKVCALCQENGVELYLVSTPRPLYETLAVGEDYTNGMVALQEAIAPYGTHLLDFNMTRPEFYRVGDDEFKDNDHLNNAASTRFSHVLADTIALSEKDADSAASGFFPYDEWDEFAASVDRISAVWFETAATPEALEIEATAFTGSNVDVEYEFAFVDPKSGEERILQAYSADPTCSMPIDEHGSGTIVVRARIVGSDREYDRYHKDDVLF